VIAPHLLLTVLIVTLIAGCANVSSPPPRGSQAPRVRCLSDPNETGTRPLLFFFCVESP
jgi:hypothetical protein